MKKRNFNFLGILFCGILLFSCGKKEVFNGYISKDIALVDHINVEALPLEVENTSYVGKFKVLRDRLIFIDQISSQAREFDLSGKEIGTYLGTGDHPTRVGAAYDVVPYGPNEDFIVIDDFVIHHFLNFNQKLGHFTYDFGMGVKSKEELLANPAGEEPAIYYPEFYDGILNFNSVCVIDDSYFIPFVTEHPSLNAYMHSSFYTSTSSIAKFSIANNKLEKMGGEWPGVYLDHKYIPNLTYLSLTTDGINLYVGYMADYKITVYDKDLKKLKSFGISGKEMNLNYRTTTFFEEAQINNWKDLAEQSVYGSLYVDNSYIFRVYYPNGYEGNNTRMQIYNLSYDLLGDVEVPSRFNVIGKIGDYYFADGLIEEQDEELSIYKFKLN